MTDDTFDFSPFPAQFDDLRPYTPDEIQDAMRRVTQCKAFAAGAKFLFPEKSTQEVEQLLFTFRSADDFQQEVMLGALVRYVDQTISQFTIGGTDLLEPSKSYLFVSNHRDIVLDAIWMQRLLHSINMPTCNMAVGVNLLQDPLAAEVGRCTKMFKVERGGNLRAFYASLTHMSDYMRYLLHQRNESVWIAQRNGRTKDGIDTTEAALLKMLARSGSADDVTNLSTLHIVPVTVAYEWEPCDCLKAIELRHTVNGVYHKAPGEDMNSILTGIVQPKGHVHLQINHPISLSDIQGCAAQEGDLFKNFATLLDRRINAGYHLMPTNYLAHDLRSGSNQYADCYSDAVKQQFLGRIEKFRQDQRFDEAAADILLGIYANAVDTFKASRI